MRYWLHLSDGEARLHVEECGHTPGPRAHGDPDPVGATFRTHWDRWFDFEGDDAAALRLLDLIEAETNEIAACCEGRID